MQASKTRSPGLLKTSTRKAIRSSGFCVGWNVSKSLLHFNIFDTYSSPFGMLYVAPFFVFAA